MFLFLFFKKRDKTQWELGVELSGSSQNIRLKDAETGAETIHLNAALPIKAAGQ